MDHYIPIVVFSLVAISFPIVALLLAKIFRRSSPEVVKAEPYECGIKAPTVAYDARFSIRSWKRPTKKPEGGRAKKRVRAVKHLSVTVSIGVADTTVAGSGAEDVLKKADQALYRAKKKGRDRVSK